MRIDRVQVGSGPVKKLGGSTTPAELPQAARSTNSGSARRRDMKTSINRRTAFRLPRAVPWFIFRLPHPQTTWTVIYDFTARNALLFAALAILVASFWERSPSRTTKPPDAIDLDRTSVRS